MFFVGVAAMYVLTGLYVYLIGRPLNQWLQIRGSDARVTIMTVLGWPRTVHNVMHAGLTPGTTVSYTKG